MDKEKFTDGQTDGQTTTIPLRPERPMGKNGIHHAEFQIAGSLVNYGISKIFVLEIP